MLGLLRLTFAPFGLTNYVAGVTSISACKFLLGTCFYAFNCSMQIFIGCSFYGMQKGANATSVTEMLKSLTGK